MKNIIQSYKKAIKIFKRYWKKLAVFSLVSKMLVMIGLFAILPAQAREVKNISELPEVKFDSTQPNPVQIVRQNPEIKPGLSEDQKEQLAKQRVVLARSAASRAENYNPPAGGGSIDYGDLGALYLQAEKEYGVPALLIRAVASSESGEGGNMKVSSAGAMGFGQFMPGTWRHYGGDGNPYDPKDAIPAMARLLASNGAADNTKAGVRQALLAYNHADWYVNKVLKLANQFGYVIPE